ncbi:MAG: BlaI/MecI/CopY family transcriptional regulator [Microbacteriaceae bacterium]|nr:MAG: BlaI/MecI/CopY family transcriptional regulator [Microbacteriaceae bacterium]
MNGDPSGERRRHGELERQVLAVLWSADQALTGSEVHGRLQAPDLSYKTVLTVLTRLQAKGRLTREKVGRAFTFRPVPDGSAETAQRLATVLARGADRTAVLQGFVDSLAPEDEAVLRELLEGHRRAGRGE